MKKNEAGNTGIELHMYGISSNVFLSIICRLLTAVASIITTYYLILLLSPSGYGTWATLTSMIVWIMLADLGIGNSIRNLVSRSDLKNHEHRQDITEGVRAAFELCLFVSFCLFAIVVLIIESGLVNIFVEQRLASYAILVGVIVLFPLSVFSSVMHGLRAVGLQQLFQVLGALLWLLVLFLFVYFCNLGSIQIGLLAFLFVPSVVLPFCLYAWWSIRELKRHGIYISLSLGWRLLRKKSLLLQLGFRFFLLQLTGMLLYGIGNFLIYSLLRPEDVAKYDVLNKIFMLPMTFFNSLIAIYWSELSAAMGKRDKLKVSRLHSDLLLFLTAFCIGCFAMVLLTPWIISLWTNGLIMATKSEALIFAALVCIQAWACVGAVYLNVVERINGQIIIAVIAAVIMTPLSYFLMMVCGLGVMGVPVASAILTLPALFYCNFVARQIRRNVMSS